MAPKTSLTVGDYSQMSYEIKEHVQVARTLAGFAVSLFVDTHVSWKERDDRLFGAVNVLHADISVHAHGQQLHVGRAVPELPEQASIALNDGVSGAVLMVLRLSPAEFEALDLARGGGPLTLQFQFAFVLSTFLRFGDRYLVSKVPVTKCDAQLKRAYAASTWADACDVAGVHTRFLLETPAVIPDQNSILRPAYEVFRAAQASARSGAYRHCRTQCREALRLLAQALGDDQARGLDTRIDALLGRGAPESGSALWKAQRLQQVRNALALYGDSSAAGASDEFDQDDALGLLLMVGGVMRTIGKLPPNV